MSNNYLIHYAKGQTAKKHKYIAIKNGRYIYANNGIVKETVVPEKKIEEQFIQEKVIPENKVEEKSIIEKIEEHHEEVKQNNNAIDNAIKNDYEDSKKRFDKWLKSTTIGKIMNMSIGDIIEKLKHDGMDDDQIEDFLAHHGIEGQKHGVRNGPPYPLSGSQLSAEEKKKTGLSASAKEKYSAIKNKLKKAPKADVPSTTPPKAQIEKSEGANYPTRLAKASDVYRNRSMYTNKELQDYINRVNLERQIGDMARKEYEASHPVKMFIKGKADRLVNTIVDNATNYGLNQVKTFMSEALEGNKDYSGPSIFDIQKDPSKYSTKDMNDAYSRYNTIKKINAVEPSKSEEKLKTVQSGKYTGSVYKSPKAKVKR